MEGAVADEAMGPSFVAREVRYHVYSGVGYDVCVSIFKR